MEEKIDTMTSAHMVPARPLRGYDEEMTKKLTIIPENITEKDTYVDQKDVENDPEVEKLFDKNKEFPDDWFDMEKLPELEK